MSRSLPRWSYGVVAVVIQLCLGAGYSWTVFRKPIQEAYHWSQAETADPFRYLLLAYAIGMTVGGWLQDRYGPRLIATIGGFLVSIGCVLGATIGQTPHGMSFGYAANCGLGMGFGYVAALAALVKWFPDRRGFIVGLAIMGFGAGSFISAPLQGWMLGSDASRFSTTIPTTFWWMAAVLFIIVVGLSQTLKNPPDSFQVADQQPERHFAPKEVLHLWQFYALWVILFCNTAFGLVLLSEAAPFLKRHYETGALISVPLAVGLIGLLNGIGRFVSGVLSDRIGREWVLRIVFGVSGLACILLVAPQSYLQALIGVCISGFCFGAGVAMMPSTNADYFGSKYLGSNYGMVFTAFMISGYFGPMITARFVQDNPNSGYYWTFWAFASVSFLGMVVSCFIRKPRAT